MGIQKNHLNETVLLNKHTYNYMNTDDLEIINNLRLNILFNPYKPSVLFVGCKQTAQTQIRRRVQNAASYQGLHCLLTE